MRYTYYIYAYVHNLKSTENIFKFYKQNILNENRFIKWLFYIEN